MSWRKCADVSLFVVPPSEWRPLNTSAAAAAVAVGDDGGGTAVEIEY